MATTGVMAGEVASLSVDGDCVVDNANGLTWQAVGTDQTYSFAFAESNATDNATRCTNGVCEVSLYIEQIRAQRLCDSDQWRLPSLEEFETLLGNDRIHDVLLLKKGVYLSGSLYQYDEKNKIWVIDFKDGKRYVTDKILPHYVLLVHD